MNYLLSDRDHTGERRAVKPVVLSGNPETTIAVINSVRRKQKYVSGAVAFRDNERPSREQLWDLIQSFKETFCPGLAGDQFNSLFVLHEDKGNSELHFVVPSIEFASGRGKRMNIHPPGPENLRLYEAFTQVMNHRLGYAQIVPDPLKLAVGGLERRAATGRRDRDNKLFLHERLTRIIRAGEVSNRQQLCRVLNDEFGLEITRQGQDYISVKFPGDRKAKRFRGPFYRADSDYGQLLRQAREAKRDRYLSPSEYRQATVTLSELVEARRQFNMLAYLSPRRLRSASQRPACHMTCKPITTKRETTTVKPEIAAIKQIVGEAMQAVGLIRVNRPTPSVRSKMHVLNNIHGIRMRAAYQPDEDRAHVDMDLIREVENALGEVESDINAAIASMNHAKTPAERRRSELQLIKLMARKRRLQLQLVQAKIRQLSNVDKKFSR